MVQKMLLTTYNIRSPMQFIEALKLRSKLLFLFILITVGLLSVAVMGTIYLNSMKKNIDALYFGSLVPVTELNEIIQTYHQGLASTLYKAFRLEISPSQTRSEIESSLKFINKKWEDYESRFKRDYEREYLEYTSEEIQKINHYFLKIYKATKNGQEMNKININNLEKRVSLIHNVIQKLIKYEVDVANYERKQFLINYKNTKIRIGLVLLLIMLVILVISLYVFRSIQKDHTKLELLTKKLKRANKKLENVSYTDSLTSLHNRRYFNMVYEKELKRARRATSYITFMMLDIDFFKQYNDTYGHIEGDYALKTVAKVLKNSLHRPSDYVFRLGGEEFGILLSEVDESNSAKLAGDICDAIRGEELKHENSKVNEFVTISIGLVCCIADDSLDQDILISRADEMLYEAKDTGRDKYVITSNVSAAKTHKVEEESA